MKNHLDFTIDFETTALTANAAVMQVAVVPWFRDNVTDPFFNECDEGIFVGHVDLRSCIVEGFDFDPDTIKWWSEKSEAAKSAVTDGFPEPITDVLIAMLDYIRNFVDRRELNSMCLWCQGADMDIAILRNICHKYDVDLESIVPYTSFRDCRTVILEAAMTDIDDQRTFNDGVEVTPKSIMLNPSLAYGCYRPLPDLYANGSEAHDAVYDAVRSSWFTWQALKRMHHM